MPRAVKKLIVLFMTGLISIFSTESIQAYTGDAMNAPPAAYPAPFDTPEIHSRDIAPFYRWTGVLARMDARTQPLKPWQDNRQMLESLSPDDMVRKVNDIINQYDYVADITNWGVSDYWETPAEFFARGGDCEDFAIAKYAWLRSLGIAEERLRIAIVYDRIRDVPHAVLIVDMDRRAMILDSQVPDIRDSGTVNRYRLYYSINRLGWWHPAAEDVRVSMRGDMNSVEPAGGGNDQVLFSKRCLEGASLPECINAIEPSAR